MLLILVDDIKMEVDNHNVHGDENIKTEQPAPVQRERVTNSVQWSNSLYDFRKLDQC